MCKRLWHLFLVYTTLTLCDKNISWKGNEFWSSKTQTVFILIVITNTNTNH